MLPGENLKISGDIDNLQASGTEIYDKISEVTELKNKENEIKNIREEITEAYKIQDKKTIDSLNIIYKKLNVQLSTSKLDYIKK